MLRSLLGSAVLLMLPALRTAEDQNLGQETRPDPCAQQAMDIGLTDPDDIYSYVRDCEREKPKRQEPSPVRSEVLYWPPGGD